MIVRLLGVQLVLSSCPERCEEVLDEVSDYDSLNDLHIL